LENKDFYKERDFLSEELIPQNAYWSIYFGRARDSFPLSSKVSTLLVNSETELREKNIGGATLKTLNLLEVSKPGIRATEVKRL